MILVLKDVSRLYLSRMVDGATSNYDYDYGTLEDGCVSKSLG